MTTRRSTFAVFLLVLLACILALGASACEQGKPATKPQEGAKGDKEAPAGVDKGATEAAPTDKGVAEAAPTDKGLAAAGEAADKGGDGELVVGTDKGIETPNPALSDPSLATEKAPDVFKVKFETTKGDFVVEVTRAWSPNGADRVYNLVKIGFFKDLPVFRVVAGFMAQFGIPGDPEMAELWGSANIADDPVTQSNVRGTMTFATAGPNPRSTQFFINYDDNGRLDGMGFSPFGKVVEGMDVVDGFYSEYGDGPPTGTGPRQDSLRKEGVGYLLQNFPKLDTIKSATLVN